MTGQRKALTSPQSCQFSSTCDYFYAVYFNIYTPSTNRYPVSYSAPSRTWWKHFQAAGPRSSRHVTCSPVILALPLNLATVLCNWNERCTRSSPGMNVNHQYFILRNMLQIPLSPGWFKEWERIRERLAQLIFFLLVQSSPQAAGSRGSVHRIYIYSLPRGQIYDIAAQNLNEPDGI